MIHKPVDIEQPLQAVFVHQDQESTSIIWNIQLGIVILQREERKVCHVKVVDLRFEHEIPLEALGCRISVDFAWISEATPPLRAE